MTRPLTALHSATLSRRGCVGGVCDGRNPAGGRSTNSRASAAGRPGHAQRQDGRDRFLPGWGLALLLVSGDGPSGVDHGSAPRASSLEASLRSWAGFGAENRTPRGAAVAGDDVRESEQHPLVPFAGKRPSATETALQAARRPDRASTPSSEPGQVRTSTASTPRPPSGTGPPREPGRRGARQPHASHPQPSVVLPSVLPNLSADGNAERSPAEGSIWVGRRLPVEP